MRKKSRITLGSLFLAVVLLVLCLGLLKLDPVLANGGAEDMLWDNNYQDIQDTTGLGDDDPRIIAARIINIFLGFLGIISVVIIMYAGFLWMNSAGNPDKIGKAKKILIGGVIGLIIILSSFALASFILDALFDAINGDVNGNNRIGCIGEDCDRPYGGGNGWNPNSSARGCSSSADQCSDDDSLCPEGPWWSCNSETCLCEVNNLGSCYNPNTNVCNIPCSLGLSCYGEGGCEANVADNSCGEGNDTCRCCCDMDDDQCSQLYPTLKCRENVGECQGGSRGMCCGCTADNECGGDIYAVGCGSDTCCNQRPVAQESVPANNATEVCTNGLISVAFSESMKTSSLSENLLLIGEHSGTCPEESSPIDPADLGVTLGDPGANYCLVDGSRFGREFDGDYHGSFIPSRFLEVGTKYYIVVLGGELDADGNNIIGGAESFFSISMSGDYVSSFTTIYDPEPTAGICEVDRVALEPASYLFNTKNNSTREVDDNAGDPTFDSQRDVDKKFEARALSDDSQELVSIPGYAWTWTIESSATAIVDLIGPAQITELGESAVLAYVPDTANDGRSEITATINMDPGNTITAGDGDQEHDSSKVYVFICNNPWPEVQDGQAWQPWTPQDNRFNYDIAYCRDYGKNGTADDLPTFNSNGASVTFSDEVQAQLQDALQLNIFTYVAPPPPGNIFRHESSDASADNPDGGAVTLEWVGATEDTYDGVVAGYNIYWGTTSKSYNKMMDVGNVTSFDVTGLTNGVKYYFTVTAYDTEGSESSYYDEVSATPLDSTAPDTAPIFLVDEIVVGTDSVELHWKEVDQAYSYQLSYGFAANDYLISMDTKGDSAIELIGLTAGKEYYFEVRALDSSGNIGPEATFSTSTLSAL